MIAKPVPSMPYFLEKDLAMSLAWIRVLFFVSALYDIVLGAAFIAAGTQLFNQFQVPLPGHWGYIHFCCLMLIIFGLMFATVAINPRSNRNLIPFGILLKAAYVGATGYYWLNGGVPNVFKPFLVIDAAMLVLFVWAFFSLGSHRPAVAST